ncbi:anion permease [Patescibacteria group bacterium]|nr:anion permease [Patescibacteria group bacterium]MBU1703226.1 anion permease [Patescibacteria group bacterium]MBU1953846.1 anion permease [Patescibacteria group bacterium]
MELSLIVPVVIFFLALGLIAFEVLDKALVALGGAVLIVLLGFLTPEQALSAIDFETIILLMSMMMLVEISRTSGIFSWLNVKLVSITRGNPLAIAVIFSLITALFSAFLDNVTTIIIVVPITIELFRGLGRDPKPIILQEILMSNIGGALTLIGDPTHIIIGNAAKLTFNEFIVNLIVPVGCSILALIGVFVLFRWKYLKPIAKNLKTLLLSNILIRKLEYEFLNIELSKPFIVKSLAVIALTLTGFALQTQLGLPVHIIGLSGALLLAIICAKDIHVHDALKGVEWTTLLFFAGLFVMVGGIEHTGLLDLISKFIVSSSSDFGMIVMYVLWGSAVISMFLDNVGFVTVMVPVIMGMESQLAGEPHVQLLWWALALGAVMGGNGTIIGASANVVGCDLAKKHGAPIGFFEYSKYAFPTAMVAMFICTAYLLFRINF